MPSRNMLRATKILLRPPRNAHQLWRRSPFHVKVGVVAGTVLSVSLLGTVLVGGDSFAGWLEAVATLAAVLAAMYAGLYAANAWKLELAREDRWVAQQRSEQASKIAAWPAEPLEHIVGQDEVTGSSIVAGFTGLTVWLRNASDVPVTRVWVDVFLVIRPAGTDPIRREMGSQEVARVLEPTATPVRKSVAAGEVVDPNRFKPGGVEVDYWFEVSVSFRDAGGRDWQRLTDGQLLLASDAAARVD